MRGRVNNADMYFSSDDDDAPPTKISSSNYMAAETPQPSRSTYDSIYEQRPVDTNGASDEILELSGQQLFAIFCDQARLERLFRKGREDSSIGIRFCWRMHFFIGEVVINVQEFLISRQKLVNGILLDQRHIDRISMVFLHKMNQKARDIDYLKAKQNIILLYKHEKYDYKIAAELYSYFVRIVYVPLNFQMVLDFKNRGTPATNGINSTQHNLISVDKSQFSNNQPSKPQQQISQTSNQAMQTSNVDKSQQKWSNKEQTELCQIYACHDSSQACSRLLEKKLGPDPRWKTGQQIEEKMYGLVAKVFNKFMTLSTNNQNIKTFRQYKRLVLKETDMVTRKKIFRSIAVIYESMLNVDQQKKTVISQKILEVNRYCRDFLSLK